MPAPTDPRAPLVLALDTSTGQAGAALHDGALLAETTWPSGRHSSRTLLAEVARLLELAGRRAADIGAVAVALGPGSFSGLRVGISTAKGLVLALGCPLLGIPTLDTVAYPHQYANRPVWAVLDAGRNRAVVAPYGLVDGRWQAMATPEHGPVPEVFQPITGPALVCGEVSPAASALLSERAAVTVAPPALRVRRAGYLAELAQQRLRAGDSDEPAMLEPLYLHGSAAESPS